jgi:hypothetical protein
MMLLACCCSAPSSGYIYPVPLSASNAPTIALCLDKVFGTAVDIITYEYAMCDAGREQKKAMYDQQVGAT